MWGPFSVPRVDGHQYFFTIVDDCSRVVWVYLLRAKYDVLSILRTFYTLIETQYNAKIKVVRSDNAPELNFHNFFNSKGIWAYHSRARTPQ